MSRSPAVTRLVPVPVDPDLDLPVALDDPRIGTPAVLVDLDVMDANMARMQAYANRAGLVLRPHAKTHKSLAVAGRQIGAGAVGVCTATASEAEVFARVGFDDITVAYPLIAPSALGRLVDAVAGGQVTLTSDSDAVTDAYAELARRAGATLPVLVEVDTGMHRAGAPAEHVLARAQRVSDHRALRFDGILTHAGHAHDVDGPTGIEVVARAEAAVMGDLRSALERADLAPRVVSAGSTLTAPYLSAADGLTELRPGTYVYNDLRTLSCWSCTPDGIAATVLSTVVSTDGERVTVDAGNKTLTSTYDAHFGFGHPRGRPDVTFTRLSEEHGVLRAPHDAARYEVGDRLQLLPIHVCVWMDLQPEVYGVRSGHIVERLPIDLMRHSL